MGAGFDPHQCNCDNDCPDLPHCICILIHDEHRCICDCWGDDPIVVPADAGQKPGEGDRKFSRDTIVNLTARNATLGRVAAQLARIVTDDVLVSALELDKPIALSLNKVTLDTAIREIGLVRRDGSA